MECNSETLAGWQYQTLLVLLSCQSSALNKPLSLALNKPLFPYCPVCTRELQVLLDGHQLSPYKAHLHRWATNTAYIFFYNFSWQVNIQAAL